MTSRPECGILVAYKYISGIGEVAAIGYIGGLWYVATICYFDAIGCMGCLYHVVYRYASSVGRKEAERWAFKTYWTGERKKCRDRTETRRKGRESL